MIRHESRRNRIAKNVSRYRKDVLIGAQHVIVEALLPERRCVFLLERVARRLLEPLHKPHGVRLVRDSKREQVNVIGHYAVDDDLEGLVPGRIFDGAHHGPCDLVNEHGPALVCDRHEVICESALVVEPAEPRPLVPLDLGRS